MKQIFSMEGTKEIDKQTIENIGIPSIVLMENAAEGILNQVVHKRENFIIFCGTGNNGGDGIALGRKLLLFNKNVKIFILGNIENGSNEFKINYNIFKKLGGNIVNLSEYMLNRDLELEIKNSDIIIDAIFGVGLSRNVEGLYYNVIQMINNFSKYTVAIDVPSGLNCNTGKVLGISIIANETYSIEVYKKGFFSNEAQKYLGNVKIIKIGIPDFIKKMNDEEVYFLEEEDYKTILPKRDITAHKGDFGKVLILAGSRGFTGAAYIVAESAVRTGAGLVTLLIEDDLQDIFSARLTEQMTLRYSEISRIEKILKDIDVLICGPGLSKNNENVKMLEKCIKESSCYVIADADALNIISEKKDLLKYLKGRTIFTPHVGEMARLVGESISDIEDNRIEISKKYAEENNVIVLLKGYNTVITDGNKTVINTTGTSKMASGGMGDCLSGIIGSLVGQSKDLFNSAVLGAYIHGKAGDELGKTRFSVNARDVIEIIPSVMEDLNNN